MKTTLFTNVTLIASSAPIRYSTLCLTVAFALGCGVGVDGDEVKEDASITVASQAISSIAPLQDPQACGLSAGRYLVLATPTTSLSVYNVLLYNDAVAGSNPSSLCKTMFFLWNEGTAPVPPIPPTDDQFHTILFEGFFVSGPGPKHFSIKAAWQPPNGQAVVTAVNNVPAFAYALITCDLGVPCNKRFNWIGPGSDANHSFTMPSNFDPIGKDFTIVITGANGITVQTLFLLTGTTRLTLEGLLATRPCISGAACPPPS